MEEENVVSGKPLSPKVKAVEPLEDCKLEPYVNDVLVFEETDPAAETRLPFFADGYPGIVFNKAVNGVYLQPKNKKLSSFFLYGQTIEPIEICVKGTYKMIVFQLYPFATRILLGIDPKELNDNCYDLSQFEEEESAASRNLNNLKNSTRTSSQIELISAFLTLLAEKNSFQPDKSVMLAINLILQSKGQISITDVTSRLFVTERTLERRFAKEIGVSPKMLCKIIQFQRSLNQLSESEDAKMMDIVYENGFTDQSHFIRTFKKYAGLTPSQFQDLPALANF
jgi:AraC-like DNA-binding protein